MDARKKAEVTEAFSFGPWSITARKGPIITTAECEKYDLYYCLLLIVQCHAA